MLAVRRRGPTAARQLSTLAHAFFPAARANAPTRTAVVIHGMLGNKKNWRTFTRRLLAARPGWQAVVVDLRGHGESPSMVGPHTVAACAQDVARTMVSLRLQPDVVLGHSFGGKVAMSLLHQTLFEPGEQPIPLRPARHTWVMDSMPGRVPHTTRADEDSVRDVIHRMRTLPQPIPSKEHLVQAITGMGFSKGLALWMTTNVEGTEGNYRWAFNLDVAWDLFQDYCDLSLIPCIHKLQDMHRESADPSTLPRMTLVRAARNSAWTADRLAEISTDLTPAVSDWNNDGVRVVELRDAGHWVHMDNPAGLAELVLPSLAE